MDKWYKEQINKMLAKIHDIDYLKMLYSFINAYIKRRKGD